MKLPPLDDECCKPGGRNADCFCDPSVGPDSRGVVLVVLYPSPVELWRLIFVSVDDEVRVVKNGGGLIKPCDRRLL